MQEDYLFCNYDVTSIDTYNMLIDYPNILPPVPMRSHDGQFGFPPCRLTTASSAAAKTRSLPGNF